MKEEKKYLWNTHHLSYLFPSPTFLLFFFFLSIENKGQYKAWDVAALVEDTHSMYKVLVSIASTT